jgi:hypothetical protein
MPNRWIRLIVCLSFSLGIASPASSQALPNEVIIEPLTGAQIQPGAAPPSAAALILEYDRAINVLKTGLKERWNSRDDYLKEFDRSPATGSAGELLAIAKTQVRQLLTLNLREQEPWDEGPPLGVEVQRAIRELRQKRDRILEIERQ